MPAGAVLCGGASTRMGRDKATMVVDGTPMALRVAAALTAAGCAPVVAIGGSTELFTGLSTGMPKVPDLHPGEGPLGGIITALTTATAGIVVVVACDLPWLDAPTIAAIVAGLGDHDVAVADTGRLEPLCAAWRVGTLDSLVRSFAAGERAVHAALAGLDVGRVRVSPAVLQNVNAPADLGRAR